MNPVPTNKSPFSHDSSTILDCASLRFDIGGQFKNTVSFSYLRDLLSYSIHLTPETFSFQMSSYMIMKCFLYSALALVTFFYYSNISFFLSLSRLIVSSMTCSRTSLSTYSKGFSSILLRWTPNLEATIGEKYS